MAHEIKNILCMYACVCVCVCVGGGGAGGGNGGGDSLISDCVCVWRGMEEGWAAERGLGI